MILINLHPLEKERNRVRRRRAAMTDAQKAAARDADAARQRARRVADPEGVRAYERQRYYAEDGVRRSQKISDARISNLRYKYGLTPEGYNALAEAQGHACACCGSGEPGRGHEHWSIDHDHVTGRVRGLLCHNCNTGIGMLGDGVEGLERALRYLQNAGKIS